MTVYYGRSVDQFLNDGAFAGVRADGSVVAWGNPETGGELGAAAAALDGSVEVVEITSNAGAFAALLADGSVVAWGDDLRGGDTGPVSDELDASNGSIVESVVALGNAVSFSSHRGNGFAAIRDDGSVVAWGARGEDTGGRIEFEVDGGVFNQSGDVEPSPVVDLVATQQPLFQPLFFSTQSFMALRDDGSIFSVSNFDQSEVLSIPQDDEPRAIGLYEYAPGYALFDDGSVRYIESGLDPVPSISTSQLAGVSDPEDVVSSSNEVAVLSSDGSITTFDRQGNDPISRVSAEQQATEIFANENSYAALLSDGSVTTWSTLDRSRDWDISDAPRFEDLAIALNGDSSGRILDVIPGIGDGSPGLSSFSALREDGSVVTWEIGNDERDVFDQSDDTPVIDFSIFSVEDDPFEKVVASGDRFMGLTESGQVFKWEMGLDDVVPVRETAFVEGMGGTDTFAVGSGRDPFAAVSDIFASGDSAFSILRDDGSVIVDSGLNGDATEAVRDVDIAHSAYEGLSIGDVLDDVGAPIDPETPVDAENPENPEDPNTPPSLYQPSTEDLEIAARLVAYQRLGEQPEDYHAFGSAGSTSTYIADQGYQFDVLSQGTLDEGFFAVGMTSPTAEPILAIRGTSNNADDWAANFEPDGVGRSQVDESWDDIVDWIARSTEEGEALNITGHSQGGAQTQDIASRLSSPEDDSTVGDVSLGRIATFNSPGVDQATAAGFDPSDAREVDHFISSGDVVSLVGDEYIQGDVDYSRFDKGYLGETSFTSFLGYLEEAHTGYWSQQSLYAEIGTVSTLSGGGETVEIVRDLDGFQNVEAFNSSDDISAPDFSYISATAGNYDAEYDLWLDEVDSRLGLASLIANNGGATIIGYFADEETVAEVRELAPEIRSLSQLIPEGDGLVTRDATENIRENFGENFDRILSIMDGIAEGRDFENQTTPRFIGADENGGTLSSDTGGTIFDVGPGIDRVELNGGNNVVWGIPLEMNNDTISGFQESDAAVFSISEFIQDWVRPEAGSAILNIDSDGDGTEDTVLTFEGDYDLDGFVVTPFDGGTAITYESRSDVEPTVPCFTPQSLVMTKRGLVPAGDIREGDLLVTRDQGYQPVNWIGRRALSREELVRRTHLAPILIRRGALGAGIPERDMMVSPQHKMLWMSASSSVFYGDPEVFVAAKHLTYLPGIEPILPDRVVYLHFLFDQHEVVLADGAWSESFNPGRNVLTGMDKDQSTELLELFPDLRGERKSAAFLSARRSLKRHEAQVLL